MLVSFLVLVYFTRGDASDPVTIMTIIIFVLTLLLMVRQGAIFRDDALLREQRAAGLVEARYASLIRNASDVIVIVDVDGRLRFASPAAERTFAIRPEDLVGRNLLDLWVDADRDRLAALPGRGGRDPRQGGGPGRGAGVERREALHAGKRGQQPAARSRPSRASP